LQAGRPARQKISALLRAGSASDPAVQRSCRSVVRHSTGAYLIWRPEAETGDAARNCISNIRPEGIDYDTAAFKLVHLPHATRPRGPSAVTLKDDSDRRLIGETRHAH
jgi:hypothetical protein